MIISLVVIKSTLVLILLLFGRQQQTLGDNIIGEYSLNSYQVQALLPVLISGIFH